MFNSESNVKLNEWFHQNKYPHQEAARRLPTAWMVKALKSKGTFEVARSHMCPMTGNAPIPAEKRDC
jgi:hypothetical protein